MFGCEPLPLPALPASPFCWVTAALPHGPAVSTVFAGSDQMLWTVRSLPHSPDVGCSLRSRPSCDEALPLWCRRSRDGFTIGSLRMTNQAELRAGWGSQLTQRWFLVSPVLLVSSLRGACRFTEIPTLPLQTLCLDSEEGILPSLWGLSSRGERRFIEPRDREQLPLLDPGPLRRSSCTLNPYEERGQWRSPLPDTRWRGTQDLCLLTASESPDSEPRDGWLGRPEFLICVQDSERRWSLRWGSVLVLVPLSLLSPLFRPLWIRDCLQPLPCLESELPLTQTRKSVEVMVGCFSWSHSSFQKYLSQQISWLVFDDATV